MALRGRGRRRQTWADDSRLGSERGGGRRRGRREKEGGRRREGGGRREVAGWEDGTEDRGYGTSETGIELGDAP